MRDLSEYFSGEKLYGDDFSPEEIKEWFEREREGYADLGAKDRAKYVYLYHALNWHHGFRHVPRACEHVLGVGSAWGDELKAVTAQRVTILEPSDAFAAPGFRYVKPAVSGVMPFKDATFDLVACFGVLHHIPNVSFVVKEMARCMKPGGYALVREPMESMGDWRKPRPGLTACERGIPQQIMGRIFGDAGLTIERRARCMFPGTWKWGRLVRKPAYNSAFAVRMDAMISSLPWPSIYHARRTWQKLRPGCEFFVLKKPA